MFDLSVSEEILSWESCFTKSSPFSYSISRWINSSLVYKTLDVQNVLKNVLNFCARVFKVWPNSILYIRLFKLFSTFEYSGSRRFPSIWVGIFGSSIQYIILIRRKHSLCILYSTNGGSSFAMTMLVTMICRMYIFRDESHWSSTVPICQRRWFESTSNYLPLQTELSCVLNSGTLFDSPSPSRSYPSYYVCTVLNGAVFVRRDANLSSTYEYLVSSRARDWWRNAV